MAEQMQCSDSDDGDSDKSDSTFDCDNKSSEGEDSQDEYEFDLSSLASSTESEDDGEEFEEQTRNQVKYVHTLLNDENIKHGHLNFHVSILLPCFHKLLGFCVKGLKEIHACTIFIKIYQSVVYLVSKQQ